jgi:hypothetical protein
MAMSIIDQLVHTTLRIECRDNLGKASSGTGFIASFCAHEGRTVPAIITNKHVIEGAVDGLFHMTLKNSEGGPLYGQHVAVPVQNFQSLWIRHPDPAVDLAAFPLGPIIQWLNQQGKDVFWIGWQTNMLANDEFMNELNAVEDVLMIGYPNGLWDSRNNLPIVRKGITATPPFIDFEGRAEFMIDCACFPGSSGSPVVLCNMGGHLSKGGGMILGQGRVKVLGILWGGPQHTAQGDIRVVPAPTAMQPVALSKIPNNLGYCVKAKQLLWYEEHFAKIVEAERKANETGNVGAAPSGESSAGKEEAAKHIQRTCPARSLPPGKEVAALQARQQYLTTLATERCAGPQRRR